MNSPQQLAYLEAMLKDSYFVASGRVAGEYSLVCILDMLVALEPTVLAAAPKLDAFYKTMIALPEFSPYKEWPMYFNRA